MYYYLQIHQSTQSNCRGIMAWVHFLALTAHLDQEPDFASFHRLRNNEAGLTLTNSQAKTSNNGWFFHCLSPQIYKLANIRVGLCSTAIYSLLKLDVYHVSTVSFILVLNSNVLLWYVRNNVITGCINNVFSSGLFSQHVMSSTLSAVSLYCYLQLNGMWNII